MNIAQMKNNGYTNANTDYTDFLSANNIKGYGDYTWGSRVGESSTAADNGLDPTFRSNGWIIDWCYYSGTISSSNYQTVTDTVTWTYGTSVTGNPSDHYPIYTELTFGL